MKLSSKLPEGDHNGLAAVEKDMLGDPKKPRVALLIIDGEKTITNVATGARELTARIRHIDMLHPDDMSLVERLLRRAAEYRTGQAMLPIQMEDEIDRILTEVMSPEPEGEQPSEQANEQTTQGVSPEWSDNESAGDEGDEPEPEA